MVVPTKKMGAPAFVVDWDTVDELCLIQCTIKEIHQIIGCAYQTLADHCMQDHGITISEYVEAKSAPGKASLRVAQLQAALITKNPIMMIWLGKNYLNQTDKVEGAAVDPGEIAKQIREAVREIDSANSGQSKEAAK